MKWSLSVSTFALILLGSCAAPSQEANVAAREPTGAWSVNATWTDACCCKVPCPCLFGTPATEGFCEGASAFEVASGHYGDVSLDGVTALVTYRVGKWTKVAVDESASPAQVEAFGAVLPHVLPFVQRGSEPDVVAAPVKVSGGNGTIRYSTPGTTVELVLVETASGEPIVLENLPAKGTPFPPSHGHTQYKSVRLVHESDATGFEWTERNAFRSKLALGSE